MRLSRNNIPVGKRVHATYIDDYSKVQISFVPTYVLTDGNDTIIGVMSNTVTSHKGYHPVSTLTGSVVNQINTNNLHHIYTKEK